MNQLIFLIFISFSYSSLINIKNLTEFEYSNLIHDDDVDDYDRGD